MQSVGGSWAANITVCNLASTYRLCYLQGCCRLLALQNEPSTTNAPTTLNILTNFTTCKLRSPEGAFWCSLVVQLFDAAMCQPCPQRAGLCTAVKQKSPVYHIQCLLTSTALQLLHHSCFRLLRDNKQLLASCMEQNVDQLADDMYVTFVQQSPAALLGHRAFTPAV